MHMANFTVFTRFLAVFLTLVKNFEERKLNPRCDVISDLKCCCMKTWTKITTPISVSRIKEENNNNNNHCKTSSLTQN